MPRFIQQILATRLHPFPTLVRPLFSFPGIPPRFRLLRHLLTFYCLYAFFIRLALTIRSWPQIDHTPLVLGGIFGIGLYYDLVSGLYAAIPFVLSLMVMPQSLFASRRLRLLLYPFFFSCLYLMGFSALAEWFFWEEFGVRFNFIAVDYLVYTQEVLGNIRESYPVPLLLSVVLAVTLALSVAGRRRVHAALLAEELRGCLPGRFAGRLVAGLFFLLLPFLSFLATDNTVAHVFSNRYEQELAGNGLYQLFAAFRHNSLDYGTFYRTLDEKTVYTSLHGLLRTESSSFLHGTGADLSRSVVAPGPEKRYNVVLVMMESMSAEFLDVFGNSQGLTPNLDRLARQGLLFNRFYATGTRTVRGMEAVTLSTPPTPGHSIVKRPDNSNMFSMGFIFRDKGYDTRFLYGGYGYFDNMNAFFSGNGFEVIDRSDLDAGEISFANIWGACDEDILHRTVREIDRSHAQGKPFFGYVMTTSNHRPFTYPAGRIDIPSGTGREGGVKYADYAIGAFLDEARHHPWFSDTVFVFVADHCAGSAGRLDMPVYRYRIPLIVYAPGLVAPGVNDSLASQVDLAPTLFGLLHWSYPSKFFGKDILAADFTPRAFISTYQELGYLKGDNLTILDVRQQMRQYKVLRETAQDATQEERTNDEKQGREAIAYYQGASLLDKKRLNRWRN